RISRRRVWKAGKGHSIAFEPPITVVEAVKAHHLHSGTVALSKIVINILDFALFLSNPVFDVFDFLENFLKFRSRFGFGWGRCLFFFTLPLAHVGPLVGAA